MVDRSIRSKRALRHRVVASTAAVGRACRSASSDPALAGHRARHRRTSARVAARAMHPSPSFRAVAWSRRSHARRRMRTRRRARVWADPSPMPPTPRNGCAAICASKATNSCCRSTRDGAGEGASPLIVRGRDAASLFDAYLTLRCRLFASVRMCTSARHRRSMPHRSATFGAALDRARSASTRRCAAQNAGGARRTQIAAARSSSPRFARAGRSESGIARTKYARRRSCQTFSSKQRCRCRANSSPNALVRRRRRRKSRSRARAGDAGIPARRDARRSPTPTSCANAATARKR